MSRFFTVSLVGALAVAAGLVLVRQQNRTPQTASATSSTRSDSDQEHRISVERLREVGF